MRRRFPVLCTAVLIAAGMALFPSTARPQDEKEKPSKDSAAEKQTNPPNFYRVDYTIRELDHGKRTNTRNYTLKVEGGKEASFRVGSEIPISTGGPGQGSIHYHNVGVKMDCALKEHRDSVWLATKVELDSVAGSDAGSVTSPPIFRNLRFSDATVTSLGKPTLVGAIDDTTSEHRYEIEVTVEKIK